MRMFDRSIIKARLINSGPTVPRINRLKARKGIVTGAAVRLQNRIGCKCGENDTDSALTGCLVTLLANESNRAASSFGISPTSAKGSRGAPASSSSTPITGSMPTYSKKRNPRRRRSGPQNRASVTIVKKDHDQNAPAQHDDNVSPDSVDGTE